MHVTFGEIVLLVIGAAGSCAGGVRWYRPLRSARFGRLGAPLKRALLFLPPVCALLIAAMVTAFAAREVRENLEYLVLFTLLGSAWLFGVTLLMPLLGLDLFADALNGGNEAVAAVGVGTWFGVSFLYGGSNIGEGETVWSTVLPCLAATGLFLVAWALMEKYARLSDAIAIDRDQPSGVRLAGANTANGIILGRAAAGDYHSAVATAQDLVAGGLPVIFIIIGTIVMQQIFRPTAAELRRSLLQSGIVPAALMIGGATWWVLMAGPW